MLAKTEVILRETIYELEQSIAEKILDWIRSLTIWLTRDRADSALQGPQFVSGRDRDWVGLASQTHLASRYATELVSPLRIRGLRL